jgi:hypothetical protein
MWLLLAVDSGPCRTLEPLASEPGFAWAENHSSDVTFWQEHLRRLGVRGIVVGTSRSQQGSACESACRLAAHTLNLPVAAIEDYPGNYQHLHGGEAGLLVVESPLVSESTRQRLGAACPEIVSGASFRYDPLRSRAMGATVASVKLGSNFLWAGQPETEDALISLTRLLPHIAAAGMQLLFRAHPRDAGYACGEYDPLFALYSGSIRDVSGLSLETTLEMRPQLTLTQFSSLAIELGFRGIPAVHVLYPDAGQAKLKALTGYEAPPICEVGGSVKIMSVNETANILQQAIFDVSARMRLLLRFCAYFDVEVLQTERVVSLLKRFFTEYSNQKQVM